MFSIEYFNGAIIIAANGVKRINFLNVEKIRNLIVPLLKRSGDKILLDFEEVSFIDSKAFEVLGNLAKVSARYGKKLSVIHIGTELKEIFELIPEAGFLMEQDTIEVQVDELELVEI